MKLALYVLLLCSCCTLISCIDSDERYYSFYEKNSITQSSKNSETERTGFVRVSQNEEFVEIQVSQGDTVSESVKFKLEGNVVIGDWGVPKNYRKRVFFPDYELKEESSFYRDFNEQRNGSRLNAQIYNSSDKRSYFTCETKISNKKSTQAIENIFFTSAWSRESKTNFSINLLSGFGKMKAKSLFTELNK